MATTKLAPNSHGGLEAVVTTLATGVIGEYNDQLTTQEELQRVRAAIETIATEQDMPGSEDVTHVTLVACYGRLLDFMRTVLLPRMVMWD